MRSYEEIAESLLRRRDEYIENQRVRRNIMKKRIMALSAFCLAVLIGIGVWQADLFKTKPIETPADSTSSKQEAQTENPVESTPVESEQPSTPQTTEQPEPPAIGGDESVWYMLPYDYKFQELSPAIIYAVGEEKLENWGNQFWLINKETYTRTDLPNIIMAIEDLNIKKEDFIAYYVDNGLVFDNKYFEDDYSMKKYKDGEDVSMEFYTQEEVNLMFSEDHALRDRELAGIYVIHANGKNYTPEWIMNHKAEDFIDAGITKTQITEKIPVWLEWAPGLKIDGLTEEINKMP